MNEYLPFIVIGIVSGSVYGLAGVGLVLTYRTSGVFNFAHGAMATAGAYLFYELQVKHDIPWPVALVICVVGFGSVMGILLEMLARRLTRAPVAIVVVATIGPLLIVQAVATIRYGAATFTTQNFLPTDTFHLSVDIGYDQLIITCVGVVVSSLLALLLTRTRIGIAMRGVVDDADLIEMTGFDAAVVRRLAWMIGGGVAVLSGVLIAPTFGLDPIRLTALVVQAFGAAAIGRFRNLPWTFAGGLIIGIMAALGQKYAASHSSFQGLPASVPFIVLFAVLLVVGRRGLPTAPLARRPQLERFTAPPTQVSVALGIAALVGIAFLPSLVGTKLPVYINAVGFTIMFLSLGLLVKVAGQVSLCHAAFVAVGAVAFSRLSVGAGLPWFLALIGAGLITVPIGVMLALPAIRLSGIYLALATFGFGVLMENLVYRSSWMFGVNARRDAPRPGLPGAGAANDRQYFYVAVGVLVICIVGIVVLQRSRLGRLLRALADSPLALTTYGTGTTTTLVLLFSISAFFAGIAGGVIATGAQAAGAGGLGSLQSLLWVAVLAITGNQLIRSAVLAAALLTVMPAYLPQGGDSVSWQTFGFGSLAIVAALVAASQLDVVDQIKSSLVAPLRRAGATRRNARSVDPGWRSPRGSRTPVGPGAASAHQHRRRDKVGVGS
jgi:branched-subunit amino acid ABC-type transport system permease component